MDAWLVVLLVVIVVVVVLAIIGALRKRSKRGRLLISQSGSRSTGSGTPGGSR